jgi:hypothetical protein
MLKTRVTRQKLVVLDRPRLPNKVDWGTHP